MIYFIMRVLAMLLLIVLLLLRVFLMSWLSYSVVSVIIYSFSILLFFSFSSLILFSSGVKLMRVKVFSFICYPENGGFDSLVKYLSEHCYRGAISPLHIPDDDDKKEHYHILVSLSSPREMTSLNSEFQPFGCTAVQRVGSACSYARYLVHLDSPEKQQFEGGFNECICFGGFNIFAVGYRSPDVTDYSSVFQRIFDLVALGEFSSYSGAVLYASQKNDTELLDYLVSHCYACSQVLNSINK